MDVCQKLSNSLIDLVAFDLRKLDHRMLKCFCFAFILCYGIVTVSGQISAYLSYLVGLL